MRADLYLIASVCVACNGVPNSRLEVLPRPVKSELGSTAVVAVAEYATLVTTVVDLEGAPVNLALVTVMRPGLPRVVVREAAAPPSGQVVLDSIPPGGYLIRVAMIGYAKAERTAEFRAGDVVYSQARMAPRQVKTIDAIR